MKGKIAGDPMDMIRKAIKNKATVDALIQSSLTSDKDGSSPSVEHHLSWLMETFDKNAQEGATEESTDGSTAHRIWCLDQMISVVKNAKIVRSVDWVGKLVDFLLQRAFSAGHKLTGNLQDACRARFWTLLTELHLSTAEQKQAASEVTGDQTFWLLYALERMIRLEKDTGFVVALKKETRQAAKKNLKLVKSMELNAPENQVALRKCRSYQSLLIMLTFQLMTASNDSELETSLGFLDELAVCYERLSGKQPLESDAPKPASVLCDSLVSMLANMETDPTAAFPMKLTRKVVDMAFKHHCGDIDQDGCEVLCRVIDPSYELNAADGAAAEEDEEDEEEEGDAHSGHSDHSDASDEDGDSENDADPDEEFMGKLKAAFASELKSSDDADVDAEEETLTDEQMFSMGFDDKLAEIFRTRKLEKREKQELLKSSIDFKFRVLDLVELYGKHGNVESADYADNLLRLSMSLLRAYIVHENPAHFQRQIQIQTKGGKFTAAASQPVLVQLQTIQETSLSIRMNFLKRVLAVLSHAIASSRPVGPSRSMSAGTINLVARILANGDLSVPSCESMSLKMMTPTPSKDVQLTCSLLLAWIAKSGSQDVPSFMEAFFKAVLPHYLTKNVRVCGAFFKEFMKKTCPFHNTKMNGTALVAKSLFSLVALDLETIKEGNTEKFWSFQRKQLWFLVEQFAEQSRVKEINQKSAQQLVAVIVRICEAALKGTVIDQPARKATVCKKNLVTIASLLRKASSVIPVDKVRRWSRFIT